MSNQENQNTEEQQASSESFDHTLDSPDQEQIDARIAILSQIHREDDPEFYSVAQLNIGLTYKDLGNLETAINVWSRIRREDNPEIYSVAQLNIGLTYKDLGILKDAIIACSNIRHGDNPEIYAGAQLNLGLIYKDIGDLKTATIAWSNIRYEDNPEAYAGAQLCFGKVYQCEGNLENAIAAWSNVCRKDSSTTYAQSQLNIGLAYKDLGNLDSAITAWSNVRRNDDPEVYAWAQLGLGLAYKDLGNLDSAITAWSNVRRNDDPEVYAKAQFNLGTAHKENPENLEDAITAWSNIRCEDNPELYAVAQFTLGDVFTQRGNYKQGKEAYCNARNLLYYESERARRILDCPNFLYKKLNELAANTDKILTSLQIDLDFESKVSHYSRASTAFNLFGDEKNNEKPSNFRLSTIRGVNDPTEGLVLGKYWDQQGISETIHINETATFISCFTFNHDSLNQFRLYGKEDGLEATGISLVFNKDFFNIHLDHLGFITNPSSDNASLMEEPSKTSKTEKQSEKNDKTFFVEKCKLYRCIYLDPETEYLTLARRDKSTFYRNNRRKAEEEWEKYQDLILEKEKNFKKYLFDDNTSILRILEKVFSKDFSYTEEEKQHILKTVRFILLPLQYLVKHIAFQEEQECRIMYITHLHDEKIRHDWKKQWMYVEYEEPVLPHIDEIYLSPGAAKYQDHFRILLDRNGKESKVRLSQNPFRNKE